jgi:hypothetical protein
MSRSSRQAGKRREREYKLAWALCKERYYPFASKELESISSSLLLHTIHTLHTHIDSYGTYLRVFFKRRLLDHHQDILKLERGSSEELTRHSVGTSVVGTAVSTD